MCEQVQCAVLQVVLVCDFSTFLTLQNWYLLFWSCTCVLDDVPVGLAFFPEIRTPISTCELRFPYIGLYIH